MNVFRAALSSDFWITGIAIARYIPRPFRTKQIDRNLFFTEQKRQEYRRRVENPMERVILMGRCNTKIESAWHGKQKPRPLVGLNEPERRSGWVLTE
jgi:hypothetical protein